MCNEAILLCRGGFTCAVMARAFAEPGHNCLMVGERNHVAGNCPTERDAKTGVMQRVHQSIDEVSSS